MVNRTLPADWEWKTVEDLYNVIGGGTPSTAIPEYWDGDIPWITSADIAGLKDIRPRKRITKDAIANSATSLVPSGSLIVVTRVSLGKVALASYPLSFSQDSQALIAKDKNISPEYALYYLSQAVQIFKHQSRGTTISGVTKKQLKDLPFPLPPLPEQERIVSRIEELLSDLDAGVTALERVRAGLKRYKASVLKAAVEGRLFGYVELDDEGLPVDWRWIKIKEAGKVQLGRQRAPQHHQGPHMHPYLRVANVFEDRIDLSDVKEMNFTPSEYEIYGLEYGDILLNEGQSPEFLGRPAMYKGELPGGCFQNTLIRFQVYDFVDRNFALFVFRHYMHAGRFTQESQITTNMAHLSAGRFGSIEFPLPPLDEQRRIVAEVERRLSVVGEVESAVEAGLVRAGRLRQSVLRSAFEGRL